MSEHETWRTRKYWDQVGGLLIEEYVAVRNSANQGRRLIDAIIVLGEKKKIYVGSSFDLTDRDVIVVQTKRSRLGMSLLGQVFFSKMLIQKFKPRSIRAVAICGKTDSVMVELAKDHGIEIVVIPDSEIIE